MPGFRHVAPHTALLARALRNNSTETEQFLWRRLSRRQLGGFKFRRQFPIGRYVVDFCCYRQRLVVEVDGGQHADKINYDSARAEFLRQQGFRVIRFWDNEVFTNIDGVLEKILTALEETVSLTPHAQGKSRKSTVSCLLALLLVPFFHACASFPVDTDAPPAREVMPVPEFSDLRDYRGAIDLRLRDSGYDQSSLAELARDTQFDFICLTDEVTSKSADHGAGGFTNEVLFIPGGAFRIGGGEAQIVGINLRDPISPDQSAPKVIEAIHSQQGLAIAVNPTAFASNADYALADGIEIVDRLLPAASSPLLYIKAALQNPNGFFEGLDVRPRAALEAYDALASSANVSLMAGHDSGKPLMVLGYKVGGFNQSLTVYATHILAPERQIEPMMDGLRHGHTYVSFDLMGFVTNFALYAESSGARTLMGDSVVLSPDISLKAELPGAADEIRILQNGKIVAKGSGETIEFRPREAGSYRVEAYRKAHPWIFSNSLYIRSR